MPCRALASYIGLLRYTKAHRAQPLAEPNTLRYLLGEPACGLIGADNSYAGDNTSHHPDE